MKSNFCTFSVSSVLHGHQGQRVVPHTMVLDTFDKENDMLIFKNTYDDPENGQSEQFRIRRTDPKAPEELYFVHIEIKNMFLLPGQRIRHTLRMSYYIYNQIKSHIIEYVIEKILHKIGIRMLMFM